MHTGNNVRTYLEGAVRKTNKGPPKTSFTFGNFHFYIIYCHPARRVYVQLNVCAYDTSDAR